MVATSMHYIAGIFLAWLLGYKDNKKYWIGLIAIIPDLDGILMALLLAGKNVFGYSLSFLEDSTLGVILFAHRGISHSLFLLIAGLVIIYLLRKDKQILKVVFVLWASHLFFDFITSWKLFPFLPFSFMPAYFGLVEVFDSVLVFTSTLLLAFFVGNSLLRNEKKIPGMFAYFFVLGFGFFPSVFMAEFNMQTIILSQIAFWVIVALCFMQYKTKHRKHHLEVTNNGIKMIVIIVIAYLSILTVNKLTYAAILKTNPVYVEPLEQFAFNFNAHTYEIPQGDMYDMGIISWKGIEKQKQVRKIRNEDNVPQEEINTFLAAYDKSIHINWLNHPVFTFHIDTEGIIYANIRYAKSFIDTPYTPGPQGGIDVKLNPAGILISYRDGWFD